LLQGSISATAINVIDAEHVGEEDAVEFSPFEQLRQFDPVSQILVGVSAVARMSPKDPQIDARRNSCRTH
jgi:hypothetical protein